ncbi:MAG TPA: PEGA domain-containing protein, partial [Spirochaetia bacterium]
MRPRLRVKSLAVLVGLLECCAIALLASCATSRGSTLATVLTTQQGGTPPASPFTPPPQAPAQSPPQSRQGLEISTDPSSVEVWIDGTLKGLSPIILTDIVTGWHRVVLRKTGYHETSAWVDFNSDYMFYQATLTRITGFLQLSVTPGAAAVTLDGGPIDPGLLTLGIGTYTLSARLFGYTEYRAQVTINEAAVTNVAISLSEAPFAVTTFSVPKKTVNPENPGLLGRVEGRFSVTGPGSGEIQVIDGAGATVLSRRLPDFTTWDQSFTWNVHDGNGDALPDGVYTIVLVAVAPGKDTVTRSAVVSVDRTLKIAPRSLWSGSAGLLYAPTTDVLPEGDYQLGILAAGIALSNPDVFQAPAQLGARVGLGSSLELDATVGAIASSAAFPVGASVALR